jgi:uncharacterized membrane protein YqjE
METPPENEVNLADTMKRVTQQLIATCDNRVELFIVELQEERERLLWAIGLTLCVVAFGLLAGMTLTAVIAITLGRHFLIAALIILTLIYAAAAALLCIRLARLQRNWETLSGTLDQLRKDRECLEKQLA